MPKRQRDIDERRIFRTPRVRMVDDRVAIFRVGPQRIKASPAIMRGFAANLLRAADNIEGKDKL